ncbi:MAG: beta-propeller fold lactonase family protein, partial [Isosphaeraceae bacterium]|nr:beta-propeller fold lactonase family protein [Isosphaeraceae bacterium]
MLRRRRNAITWLAVLIVGLSSGAMAVGADDGEKSRPEVVWPGMDRTGTVHLPNGWSLKPAGRQTPLGDLPVVIAEHPTEPILAVLHAGYGEHEIVTLDAKTGKAIGHVALPRTFAGLVWSSDGKQLYAGGGFDDVIYRFDHADGLLSNKRTLTYPDRPDPLARPRPEAGRTVEYQRVPAGLALSEDGKYLWVANAWGHSVARFDTTDPEAKPAELGLDPDSFPYGLAWDETRHRLYVSLWGKAQVAVIDTEKGLVLDCWKAEDHPNEMLLARKGKVLYVANANRNTVSVFDTEAGKAVETIGTAIDPRAPAGCTPSSLALSPDESILFVANANTNDVAVVNVKDLGGSTPLGFIPVGWYPTSVRVSRDGKTLYVANGKGGTSKANRDGPRPGYRGESSTLRQYIGGLFQGTLSTIPMPTPRQMADYSKTVYECSPLQK